MLNEGGDATAALLVAERGTTNASTTPTSSPSDMTDAIQPDAAASLRPVYHFTAPSHWLNDPNGLVYVDGVYHLFYQHHPFDASFGAPHWGHASSRNLVEWRHHPIALEPDELGVIFSGSAVVDEADTAGFGPGAIVAAFTHHLEHGVERQSIAYSTDGGLTWLKYAGNPVLEAPPDTPDFRDPRVLRWESVEESHWVMLLAVGLAVWIYVSDDLISWTRTSVFEPASRTARVWECPDLFELPVEGTTERRWVLAVGVDSADIPALFGTRYFVGDFDGRRFTESHTDVHWADHGADFYAAQTWSNCPDGRRIWIGWMSNWGYAREVPTNGWRGAMSIPRELGLVDTPVGPRLTQRPVVELEAARRPMLRKTDVAVTGDDDPLTGLTGAALDIDMTVDLARSTGRRLRLSVRVGPDEATDILLDLENASLAVDRHRAGRHMLHREYSGPRLAAVATLQDTIDIRVLVDTTSIEVFAGGGLVAISEQIFPSAGSTGLALDTPEGTMVLHRLDVYAIDPRRDRTG